MIGDDGTEFAALNVDGLAALSRGTDGECRNPEELDDPPKEIFEEDDEGDKRVGCEAGGGRLSADFLVLKKALELVFLGAAAGVVNSRELSDFPNFLFAPFVGGPFCGVFS